MSEAKTIDIRNLSVKCGNCSTYQTLSHFARQGDWNVYTYECENDSCDPAITRTFLEVPVDLDAFARRDPNWRGGKRHAGGQERAGEAAGQEVMQVFEYDPFTPDD